ncbi:MAG TPA: ATP-binding cassette domain-containing protein [bacterium]|nr:ATP-binding cassette domain-containing protein [bacterium]HEV2439084.1 ATP-binding cassette domain-containing protein [bacterium]
MPAPIIDVQDLTKRFGAIDAVRGVSFSVAPGEIFGFLGPNGAGKTTTIKILATLLRPTSGRASLAGYDVVARPADVRRAMGIVFQDPSLDNRLTAEQNLRFHAMLYGVPPAQVEARIAAVLGMVELAERRRALVATYSGGMKRRLEIARGLLHRPRVLFLDEPTIGLDLQTRNHIWEYVLDLRRREGVTVFMTTHYIEESEHCDRIAIIDDGRIVALDTPEALRRQVGGDVITITSPDAPSLAREIEARFGGGARAVDGQVVVEQERGPEFVPRVAAAFPSLVTAVAVTRPTLDDVFLKLTGHAIREESASAMDQLRTMARAWGGRRR